jgi:hypothetical protein
MVQKIDRREEKFHHLLIQHQKVKGQHIVRSFKFILKVGVEDSIVNVHTMYMDNGSAD